MDNNQNNIQNNQNSKVINIKEKNWFMRKTKSQKISFIVSIILFLISILVLSITMHLRTFFGNDIADSVYGQGIENGWVVISKTFKTSVTSWIATFIVVSLAFVLIFVINFLTRLLTGKGRKAKTIGALIRSLTKYVVIIAAIAIILSFWGVNITSILAGVGIVTLIVGLGCQTLVQDVIAGLFIVFDDYFAVGDICIIDGFRGTIIDIGLKSTKIKDAGGNIKSINNSSITTVVDLSREDSMATVNFAFSYNEDPRRIEGVLIKELPNIKKRIPQITSDISYKGISEIGNSDVSYLIICFCKETDRFQVTRDLNREMLMLARDYDLQYVYPQIVVNQPDDTNRPLPTEEEKEISNKGLEKLRAVPLEEEKKGFNLFKKAKKSFDETANNTFDSNK
jgi:moderate conductance mechanosensitive channel